MKKILIVLLSVSALLACASVARADDPFEVLCGPDCWGALGGGGSYTVPWGNNTQPVEPPGGDNSSSVCIDHGGVYSITFEPGYGWYGEPIAIAVVECMDGTVHRIYPTENGPNQPYDPGPPPADDPPADEQPWDQTASCEDYWSGVNMDPWPGGCRVF